MATITVKGEVQVTLHEDSTVTFVVLLESGERAAFGERCASKQAAHDIGSAFLLEADSIAGDQYCECGRKACIWTPGENERHGNRP